MLCTLKPGSLRRCKTLQQALANYTSVEVLDGDNKYRCPLNKKLVRAERSTRIQDPPNVLTMHLKRFEFGTTGKKVGRHISFTKDLDLAPYLHASAPSGSHMCARISRNDASKKRARDLWSLRWLYAHPPPLPMVHPADSSSGSAGTTW